MSARILIVEDEQHIADGLAFNLRADGHVATVARDGERALELLLRGSEPFDAVILDVMLPGKDGFVVAAEVRAAGQYVPILMLTARSRPEDVLRGFEAVRAGHPDGARQWTAAPPALERTGNRRDTGRGGRYVLVRVAHD